MEERQAHNLKVPRSKLGEAKKETKNSAKRILSFFIVYNKYMTYLVRITNQMATFLNLERPVIVTRMTITKLIWNYIKSNKLQSSENSKKIILNTELAELFHLSAGQTLNLFTLFNHITNHIIGRYHL